jgi:hypothetical protein
MRALRVSAHGHRALTEKEVEKLIQPVLEAKRAKFGGQGFARTSTFINIAREDFLEAFTELFDEHIDGFNGKSYVKMGKAQEDMLWKAKVERESRRRLRAAATFSRCRSDAAERRRDETREEEETRVR